MRTSQELIGAKNAIVPDRLLCVRPPHLLSRRPRRATRTTLACRARAAASTIADCPRASRFAGVPGGAAGLRRDNRTAPPTFLCGEPGCFARRHDQVIGAPSGSLEHSVGRPTAPHARIAQLCWHLLIGQHCTACSDVPCDAPPNDHPVRLSRARGLACPLGIYADAPAPLGARDDLGVPTPASLSFLPTIAVRPPFCLESCHTHTPGLARTHSTP